MPHLLEAKLASCSNSGLSPLKLLPVLFWYAERSLLICSTALVLITNIILE